jgi:hypothetical protein
LLPFKQRTARHQTLLDFVSGKLHVEIARESLDDFVQPVEDRLECGKFRSGVDLLVESL